MLTWHAIYSKRRVLIVEDDTHHQHMLEDICHQVGFACTETELVKELDQANRILDGGGLDLVLLDLVLEDSKSPIPAVRFLDKWAKKKLPVIVVSEHTEAVKSAERTAAGVVVIRKPGAGNGERALFEGYLQFAIRTAISSDLGGYAIDGNTGVLMVEGDPGDKAMLTDILREAGLGLSQIMVVEELEQAMGRLDHGGVDLVLLDLALDDKRDARRAVELLENWNNKSTKTKIPVIVVSEHPNRVGPAARAASGAVVIMKPGPGDGERVMFSDYLEYAIRTAISQRLAGTTIWDRIRQPFGLKESKQNAVEPKHSKASERSPDSDRHPNEIKRTSQAIIVELVSHTLVMVFSLGSIWLIHWVLDKLLGKDFRFIDLFPIRWLIDVAELGVFARFFWGVLTGFRRKR